MSIDRSEVLNGGFDSMIVLLSKKAAEGNASAAELTLLYKIGKDAGLRANTEAGSPLFSVRKYPQIGTEDSDGQESNTG